MVGDLVPLDLGQAGLAPVGLAELIDRAALLRRVDRKYVVPRAAAAALVASLAGTHRVLAIDGRRATTYDSVYFDTPDLRCCRDHVSGRRRRFKVRSRLYVEDALCRLEVKARSGRGETVKSIVEQRLDRHGLLGDAERCFVGLVLAEEGLVPPGVPLTPSLELAYQRVTLADLDAGTRVTLDAGLVAWHTQHRHRLARLDDDHVVVETKGGVRAGEADRLLLFTGQRPRSFSKYVACVSLLRDDVPDNDVRRMLGRQLHLGTRSPSPLPTPSTSRRAS